MAPPSQKFGFDDDKPRKNNINNSVIEASIFVFALLVGTGFFVLHEQNSVLSSVQAEFDSELDRVRSDLKGISFDQGVLLGEIQGSNFFRDCVVDQNSLTPYQLPVGESLVENRVRFVMDCPATR